MCEFGLDVFSYFLRRALLHHATLDTSGLRDRNSAVAELRLRFP